MDSKNEINRVARTLPSSPFLGIYIRLHPTEIRMMTNIFRNIFGKPVSPLTVPPVENLLENLNEPFRSTLISMYKGEKQKGADGQLYPLEEFTRISPGQGMWLYEFCLAKKPISIIEIGLAYGFSTLFFLAAITKNQMGYLTATDPYQTRAWKGIGHVHATTHAPQWGEKSAFEFYEDSSNRVAVDMARQNRTFDLIFIDGNHLFDAALVDFYMYAPLCKKGGYLIFDDMWMSSIQSVIHFIRKNRNDFEEVPATPSNIAVFQKVNYDQRRWDHFIKFPVGKTSTPPTKGK
ncbi:MAG: class I SAM-dependent methyltransferase [Gemmatimonadetes bacterium]|nr:MAG: class I SAM-dependent methyltransferase [Gemmatimonadota bacterium]